MNRVAILCAASLLLFAPTALNAAGMRRDPALNQRLTDALGVKSWAEKIVAYGPVKFVTYACDQCRVGGFAFVDSQSKLVTFRNLFDTLQYRIDNDAALQAGHSLVLLTRGGEAFQHVAKLPGGGQRFLFTQSVSECEACAPFTTIRFGFDFDAHGMFEHYENLGYASATVGLHGTYPPMEQ